MGLSVLKGIKSISKELFKEFVSFILFGDYYCDFVELTVEFSPFEFSPNKIRYDLKY